jgi:hypothetical protein
MTAPPRNDEPGLSRRDELAVSGAAMSDVHWTAAGATGAVVAGADLLLHLTGGGLGLSSALSAGTVAFCAVAGGSVLVRQRPGRAVKWARSNPWRFAVLPGMATAIVVFLLSVLVGSSGMLGGGFTALWHGAIAYGLTGATGAVVGSRRKPR